MRHSFGLRPFALGSPNVVAVEPLMSELERGKRGVSSRIPPAHDAVKTQGAVIPAMRGYIADRVGVDSRASTWITMRKDDRYLNLGAVSQLIVKTKRQLFLFRDLHARLFAMLIEFFNLISDARWSHVG